MRQLIDRTRAELAKPEPQGAVQWSEGICGDGAAILRDGVMVPIEEVVASLNRAEQRTAQPEPEGPSERIISIAKAVQKCAFGWEPDVQVIGNICAEDVADLCSAVLVRYARPADFDPRLIALATTSEQIPPGPYSEHELRTQWNAQADEFPPLPPSSQLILQQDDCAPDTMDSFRSIFPTKADGLTLEEFKRKAQHTSFFDGFESRWKYRNLILVISADDPFYALYVH
jgi:hypothetical protein